MAVLSIPTQTQAYICSAQGSKGFQPPILNHTLSFPDTLKCHSKVERGRDPLALPYYYFPAVEGIDGSQAHSPENTCGSQVRLPYFIFNNNNKNAYEMGHSDRPVHKLGLLKESKKNTTEKPRPFA